MTLQELTTFDRVFQNYLSDNDHDEDARDLYIETMEAHTTHLEIWNDIFDIPQLKDINDMMNRMS
jgi:hypothetical protein